MCYVKRLRPCLVWLKDHPMTIVTTVILRAPATYLPCFLMVQQGTVHYLLLGPTSQAVCYLVLTCFMCMPLSSIIHARLHVRQLLRLCILVYSGKATWLVYQIMLCKLNVENQRRVVLAQKKKEVKNASGISRTFQCLDQYFTNTNVFPRTLNLEKNKVLLL